MRTLRLMAEDMSDPHLPGVLQAVLPRVLAGVADGTLRGLTLRLALAVVAACVKSLPMMVDSVRKQLRRVLRGCLPEVLQALGHVLTAPLRPPDPLCVPSPTPHRAPATASPVEHADVRCIHCRDWAARQEALIILQELITCMGKTAAPHVAAAMGHAWAFCEAAPAVFQAVVVEEGGAAAGDAEGVDFETVVEQLYEFFLTLLGMRDAATGKTQAALLHSVLPRLLHHTVTFMQVRCGRALQQSQAEPSLRNTTGSMCACVDIT